MDVAKKDTLSQTVQKIKSQIPNGSKANHQQQQQTNKKPKKEQVLLYGYYIFSDSICLWRFLLKQISLLNNIIFRILLNNIIFRILLNNIIFNGSLLYSIII